MNRNTLILYAGILGSLAACFKNVSPNSEVLVRGGTDPALSEDPAAKNLQWIVKIYNQRRFKDPTFACTGFLIAPDVVVTAAHCVTTPEAKTLQFFELRVEVVSEKKTYAANTIRAHSEYQTKFGNSSTGLNDIGLIKLATPVQTAKEMKLPTVVVDSGILKAFVDKKPPISIFGFGRDSNDKLPETLLFTRKVAVSKTQCGAPKSASGANEINFFCAKKSSGVPGSCAARGDSGGPVTYFDKATNHHYILGVISRGSRVDIYETLSTLDSQKNVWVTEILKRWDRLSQVGFLTPEGSIPIIENIPAIEANPTSCAGCAIQ